MMKNMEEKEDGERADVQIEKWRERESEPNIMCMGPEMVVKSPLVGEVHHSWLIEFQLHPISVG